jgi:hypothetical protein
MEHQTRGQAGRRHGKELIGGKGDGVGREHDVADEGDVVSMPGIDPGADEQGDRNVAEAVEGIGDPDNLRPGDGETEQVVSVSKEQLPPGLDEDAVGSLKGHDPMSVADCFGRVWRADVSAEDVIADVDQQNGKRLRCKEQPLMPSRPWSGLGSQRRVKMHRIRPNNRGEWYMG